MLQRNREFLWSPLKRFGHLISLLRSLCKIVDPIFFYLFSSEKKLKLSLCVYILETEINNAYCLIDKFRYKISSRRTNRWSWIVVKSYQFHSLNLYLVRIFHSRSDGISWESSRRIFLIFQIISRLFLPGK